MFEQRQDKRISLLRPDSFWKIQAVSWSSFAALIFGFYWPSLETLRALESLSLKIVLSVVASVLLRPLCRFVWRRRALFVPLASLTIGCAAWLAVINEAIVDSLMSFGWNSPEKVTLHALLTRSLRYQFALAGWCISYFALKFFNQMEQQQELVRRAKVQQRDGLIASFRYQLPGRFLTGMLDGISQAIRRSDGPVASLMIAHLGDLLRNVLSRPEDHLASLSDELAHTLEYLGLRHDLLGIDVRLDVDAPEEAGDFLIPRWLLVPLIDEYLHHSEPDPAEMLVVHLAIGHAGTRLTFRLSKDRGAVPTPLADVPVRFESVRSLLDLVYGKDASFEFDIRNPSELNMNMPARSADR